MKRLREIALSISLIVIVSAAFAAAPAFAANSEGNWSATITPVKEARPGSTVTHVVHVTAPSGAEPSNVDWAMEIPVGWIVFGPSSGQVTVKSGQDEVVFVAVSVPSHAVPGLHPLRVRLSGADSDGTTLETGVQVEMRRHVVVLTGEAMPGSPDKRALHTFVLRNDGNARETVVISAESRLGWHVEPDRLSVQLAPGEIREVVFEVEVPFGAAPGTHRDTLQVTVRDEADPATEHFRASVTTPLLPPRPHLVPKLRPDALGAHLRFNTGRMVSGERWDPSLSLRARGTVGIGQTMEVDLLTRQDQEQLWYLRNLSLAYRMAPWRFQIGVQQPSSRVRLKERFLLTYDFKPWWIAAGDASVRLSTLVPIYGRGGAVRYFWPSGTDVGALVLDNQRGLTLGHEFPRGKLRTTFLDRHERGNVWSLGGEWTFPPEWRLSAEWADVNKRSLWSAGARWARSPWSATARYFWYGNTPDGRTEGNRSGYRFHWTGRSGQVNFSLTAGDVRTNAVNDPERPVTSNQTYNLSTAFPLRGTNTRLSFRHLRARTVREHPDYDPVDKQQTIGRLAILRPTRPWFWRFDARAQETIDRRRDRSDGDFRITALAGRRWERIGLSAGVEWYGDNSTLSRAWRVTHLTPAARFDYWGPRPTRLRFVLEARAGRIPRLGAKAEMHLSERFRIGIDGDVRYRSNDTRARYGVWLGWDFDLPVPGIYSEGQLSGKLRVVNVDGDLHASGLEGTILRANGLQVAVDPSGDFLFPPLPPGEYDLTLDASAVYELLIALPLTVTVERGKETHVEIPVRAMSRLAGRVEVAWSNGNGVANGNGNGFYPNGIGWDNGNGNGRGNGNGFFRNGNGLMDGNGRVNGNGFATDNGFVNGTGNGGAQREQPLGQHPSRILAGRRSRGVERDGQSRIL